MYAGRVQIISPFPPFPLDRLSPMVTVEILENPTTVAMPPPSYSSDQPPFPNHMSHMDHRTHGFDKEPKDMDNKEVHIEQEQASEKDNSSASDMEVVEAMILVYNRPMDNMENKPSSKIPPIHKQISYIEYMEKIQKYAK
jgi:hypothetical protein